MQSVADAITVLRNSGVAILPTETVYALAANAYDDVAVAKVFAYKDRDASKALPVAYRALEDALRDVHCDALSMQLAHRFMPGPLTLVLPVREDSMVVADVLAGLQTIAVRIPDHDLLQKILAELDFPIVATSANRSITHSTTSAQSALQSLSLCPGNDVAVVDDGECRLGRESTIVCVQDGEIRVLREGCVSIRELSALGPVRIVEVAR